MVMRSVKQLGSRFLVAAVLTVMLVSSCSSSAFAVTELAYDDGTNEANWTGSPGTMLAVRFSLPPGVSTARLLKVRYYISTGPQASFNVRLFGSDGLADLLEPPLAAPPTAWPNWLDIDLTAKNIVVSGGFYVAIEFLVDSSPGIGGDTTNPDGRSYSTMGGPWWLWDTVDYMIRAVIDPLPAPVGGVLVPANKLVLLSPYLALLGLVGAVTVAVAATRRRRA